MTPTLTDLLPVPLSADRLTVALTHRSYVHEQGGEDNERLEFLGDAVLSLCATNLIYEAFPLADEGKLSAMRSRIVSEDSLAAVAVAIGLPSHMRLGKGEEKTGRTRPSVLSGTVEALLGAVWLEHGYAAARRVVDAWLGERIRALSPDARDVKPIKNRLQELIHKRARSNVEYVTISKTGPDHEPTFVVAVAVDGVQIAAGTGSSKSAAEQRAAEAALATLEAESS